MGVPSPIYYKKPLHLQDTFRKLGYKKGDFPVSEWVSDCIFRLPMHPYRSDSDIDGIIETIAVAAE